VGIGGVILYGLLKLSAFVLNQTTTKLEEVKEGLEQVQRDLEPKDLGTAVFMRDLIKIHEFLEQGSDPN